MKKTCSLLLVLALLLTLGCSALAEGAPALVLSSAEAAPGETVELTLSIVNSSGIKGISAELVYDESVLTLLSATPLITIGTWMVDSIANDHLVYWYSPTTYSGEAIVSVTFRVAETAPAGAASVGLRFGDWDGLYDSNGEDIADFSVTSGFVTVPDNAQPETYTVSYDANGGYGAPAAQTKTEGEPLTLSAAIPARAAESAGSYTVTLVGAASSTQPEPEPEGLALALTSVEAAPGEEIELTASILNNPGIKGLSAELVYDEAVLTILSATPLIDIGTWMIETIADDHLLYWYSPTAYSGETVAAIRFRVSADAPEGTTSVGLRFGEWDGLYDGSGDELTGCAVLPGAVVIGGTSADLTAARTTSYIFAGWNTAADGSGTAYAPGVLYAAEANVTLYAQWHAETVTEAVELSDQEREGFLLLGWAEEEDAECASFLPGVSFIPTEDSSLFAVWLDLSKPDCVLPGELTELGSSALADTQFRYAAIPAGMSRLGDHIFDGCDRLAAVFIPAGVTEIESSAFDGVPDGLVLLGEPSSEAEHFAAEHGFRFVAWSPQNP